MKPFKTTTKGMALGPGLQVRLTPGQAASRLGSLKKLSGEEPDGRAAYAVVEKIVFKPGDPVEYGGEVDQVLTKPAAVVPVAAAAAGKKSADAGKDTK